MREGVRLCARFSLATSSRDFCGPEGAPAALRRALVDDGAIEEAAEALLKFEALAPYLTALAVKHKRAPLDLSVVEAYWIGNELLESFTREDFLSVLKALSRRGLPPAVAAALGKRLPETPIPHHAFHVFFVGVGQVTGSVPSNLENMDRCRPSWGLVMDRRHGVATVERQPLIRRGRRLALGAPAEVEVRVDPLFEREVRPGDLLAMHWGEAAVPLSWDARSHLELYTLRAIEAANEAALGRLDVHGRPHDAEPPSALEA
jgi:hypothetical protein